MRNLSREMLLSELAALRPELERDGVTHLALFGSRARGDNRIDSDIDLLIDIADGRKFSLLDVAGIYVKVEDRFALPSSVVLRRGAPDSFLRELSADLIPVF